LRDVRNWQHLGDVAIFGERPLCAISGQSQTCAPTRGRFLQRAGWSRPV